MYFSRFAKKSNITALCDSKDSHSKNRVGVLYQIS